MACTDRAGFHGAIAPPCAPWTSPQCPVAVSRALDEYGADCLRLPLFDLETAPPIALYVCPRSSTPALTAACASLGLPPDVHTTAATASGGATATGSGGEASTGMHVVAAAVPLLAGVGFAGHRVVEWAKKPYTTRLEGSRVEIRPTNVLLGIQYRAMEAGFLRP